VAKSGTQSRVGPKGAEGSTEKRQALVDAAVETLKVDGFVGASARAIASRAGCNQGLVFYYFGSVTNLLLAALDAVSAERLERYEAAVAGAGSATELVAVAAAIFREDLDAGYVTVLVEMIAGASSVPGLGPEVARRIAPWTEFAKRATQTVLAGSPLGSLLPPGEIAYAIVAVYLGIEMLSHLDGDPTPATSLFDHATQLASLFDTLGRGSGPRATKEEP